MSTAPNTQGDLTQIDYLQLQVNSLKEELEDRFTALDHDIRGNGKPGLKSDVREVKMVTDSLGASMEAMEKRLLTAIRDERDDMVTTQKIGEIAKRVAIQVQFEHDEKLRQEQKEKDKQAEEAARLAALAPGTWGEFRKFVIPAIVGGFFTIIITFIIQAITK